MRLLNGLTNYVFISCKSRMPRKHQKYCMCRQKPSAVSLALLNSSSLLRWTHICTGNLSESLNIEKLSSIIGITQAAIPPVHHSCPLWYSSFYSMKTKNCFTREPEGCSVCYPETESHQELNPSNNFKIKDLAKGSILLRNKTLSKWSDWNVAVSIKHYMYCLQNKWVYLAHIPHLLETKEKAAILLKPNSSAVLIPDTLKKHSLNWLTFIKSSFNVTEIDFIGFDSLAWC